MQPHIRPVEAKDAARLAELMTQLGYPSTEPQLCARIARIAEDPTAGAFVAEVDGRVVGMIGLLLHRGYEFDGYQGEITPLVVDEVARGRGIGRALTRVGEAWFRDHGVARVKINTAHHRREAHAFYEHLGYRSTGLRVVKMLKE